MLFLADHNLKGQALLLWGALAAVGWLDLLPMRLLTGNRNMIGPDSLEQAIREETSPTSLPVITIANVSRIDERTYRERCGSRLVEIVMDLDNYLGTGRVFVP